MPCTLEPWEERWEERRINKANRNINEEITDQELLTKIACAGMRHMEATGEPIPSFAKGWWKRHKSWDKQREKEAKKK